MEVVREIGRSPTDGSDRPVDEVVMKEVTVAKAAGEGG
jgi:hypothetical protein